MKDTKDTIWNSLTFQNLVAITGKSNFGYWFPLSFMVCPDT